MDGMCRQLREAIPQIVMRWNEMIAGAPWSELSEEDRINNMPGVVLGMVEASLCDPTNAKNHREHVLAAVHHGALRRRQSFDEEHLFDEYDVLRKAFWQQIREIEDEAERRTMGILRIDLALTVATHASIRGFFRQEIERTADWEEEIAELVASSPFLRGFR